MYGVEKNKQSCSHMSTQCRDSYNPCVLFRIRCTHTPHYRLLSKYDSRTLQHSSTDHYFSCISYSIHNVADTATCCSPSEFAHTTPILLSSYHRASFRESCIFIGVTIRHRRVSSHRYHCVWVRSHPILRFTKYGYTTVGVSRRRAVYNCQRRDGSR